MKNLEAKYKGKKEFPGGTGDVKQKTLCGGEDIFFRIAHYFSFFCTRRQFSGQLILLSFKCPMQCKEFAVRVLTLQRLTELFTFHKL